MKGFRWLIWIMVNGCFLNSNAQQVDIHAKVDKQEIMIGDQFHLDLYAKYDPQKYYVQFPVIPDTIHQFECIRREKPDTNSDRNQSMIRQRITWSHFDSGLWVLPSFQVRVQPKNGDSAFNVMTDSFLIKVNTLAVDTSKPFKPIMGIRAAKKPMTEYLTYFLLGLILITVIIVIIWLAIKRYKKYHSQKQMKPEEPVLTPYERALKGLQQLQSEAGYLQGEEKNFHTGITDVLRRYLDEQFGMDTMEKTSTEIMQSVKRQKALANARQSLRQVLETADIVKFAKATLSREEHEHSLELAREVVQESYRKLQQQTTTDRVHS